MPLLGNALKIGIVYESQNRQVIQNAITDSKKLQDSMKKGSEEAKKMEQQEKRLRTEMEAQRLKIQELRANLMQFSAVLVSVAGLYALLSRNSDALKSINEKTATSFGRIAAVVGDELALQLKGIIDLFDKVSKKFEEFNRKQPGVVGGWLAAGLPGLTSNLVANFLDPKRVQKLNQQRQEDLLKLQSKQTERTIAEFAIQTAQAQGDIQKALELQLNLKRKILEQDNATNIQLPKMLSEFDKMADAQKEQLRLAELSLKTYRQIGKDFQRNVVGAFRSGISDPIYNLLQGKRLSMQDLIEPLKSGLNRAVADAMGEVFVKKIFSGGAFSGLGKFFGVFGKDKSDPTARAIEEFSKKQTEKLNELNKMAAQIARCSCNTSSNSGITATGVTVIANNVGRMGGFSGISGLTATLTAAAPSTLDKIGAIAGGISGLMNLSGLGGVSVTGAGSRPDVTSGLIPRNHSGGWVHARHYAVGGEVPAFVQPGEFVVRRNIAQENKGILEGMNKGDRLKGSQNVFMIKTNDAQSFAQMLSVPSSRNQLEVQLIKLIMTNGKIRQVIKDFAK